MDYRLFLLFLHLGRMLLWFLSVFLYTDVFLCTCIYRSDVPFPKNQTDSYGSRSVLLQDFLLLGVLYAADQNTLHLPPDIKTTALKQTQAYLFNHEVSTAVQLLSTAFLRCFTHNLVTGPVHHFTRYCIKLSFPSAEQDYGVQGPTRPFWLQAHSQNRLEWPLLSLLQTPDPPPLGSALTSQADTSSDFNRTACGVLQAFAPGIFTSNYKKPF